jgi:hypothetical protein
VANLEQFGVAVQDILSNIVARISNSFHTEGELLGIHAQIQALGALLVADVEADAAGLVSPGAPVAVDGPAPVATNPFVNA